MGRPRIPIDVRLASKTYMEPMSGCWLWTGSLSFDGYGMLGMRPAGERPYGARAHRLSYEYHVGPIPEGFVLDHLCRTRSCVNPDHLEPVTYQENLMREPRHNGKPSTHCRRGHPYTEANAIYLMPSPRGYARRICARCADDILGTC